MRKLFNFLAAFGMLFMLSNCSSVDNPSLPKARLNGSLINFGKVSATDMGQGLELNMTSTDAKISILLSDKIDGKYTIQNKNNSGRIASSGNAVISVIQNSEIYYGISGDVILNLSNGELSVRINNATIKTWAGETQVLSGLVAGGVELQQLPEGCRITSYSYTVDGILDCYQDFDLEFLYNGEGKIARAFGPKADITFVYDIDGKLLGYNGVEIVPGGALQKNLQLFYSSGKLSSFTLSELPDSDSVRVAFYDYNYSLVNEGEKIIGADVLYTVNSKSTYSYEKAFGYKEGNMNKIVNYYENGTLIDSLSYSTFDAKNNPYYLLADLMSADFSFINGGMDHDFDLFSLQSNNPLTRFGWAGVETFKYVYNASGYPTKIIFTPNEKEYCRGVVTINIEYDGCK